MLFVGQDGEQVEGCSQKQKAQDVFEHEHPGARTRQDFCEIGPDAEDYVGQGHANANCPEDNDKDAQGLGEGPAQDAAKEGA